MKIKFICLFMSLFSTTRDPFVYQQKQRIVAEGEINGESIKVQADDTGVKIKRKKSLQLR